MFVRSLLAWMVFLQSSTHCANILVVSPCSYYSHHVAFLKVWEALMLRGHNITMVTSFQEKGPHNITIIDSKANAIIFDKAVTLDKLLATSKWFLWPLYMEALPYTESNILSVPGMQDIVHNHTKYKFDVIIVEIWYTSIFALSKIFNCPYVAFSSLEIPDVMHWHLGNQLNHVGIPEMNFGIYRTSNFFDRLTSGLFTFIELYREHFIYLPLSEATLNEHFRKYTAVTSKELKQDIDLVLVNVNPVLKSVGAVGQTTIFVGGGNHLAPPKLLPENLKSYLDSAKEGFIYLSLGSIVQSKNLEGNLVNDLIDVISKLPYKILWKFEDDNLPNKPANVKIVKWAPQQDVLRHPNIKLFISQGGLQSMEEALYCHVPLLIMPFYGDQHKNGQLATFKGFGKAIQHKPKLNKLEMETTIHELINNPAYKKTAKRIATMMNDTYMTGLEKSVWWIEYVIRNNGTKELRNPAAKLPFYQYYALDIIGFLSVVTFILVYVIIALSRFILTFCQNILSSTQQKKKTL